MKFLQFYLQTHRLFSSLKPIVYILSVNCLQFVGELSWNYVSVNCLGPHPGTPGSVITLHNHEVKRSWPVRIVSYVPYIISKTYLYNFDPLKPHFYIVKLGFTGVYIIFLISDQNLDCGYSLEPPRGGGSNKYPQSMFYAETWKISEFFIWKFSFFGDKIFSMFE